MAPRASYAPDINGTTRCSLDAVGGRISHLLAVVACIDLRQLDVLTSHRLRLGRQRLDLVRSSSLAVTRGVTMRASGSVSAAACVLGPLRRICPL